MFLIECRLRKINDSFGAWFSVWETPDGTDCANYLRQLTQDAYRLAERDDKITREYKMSFVVG